MRPHCSRKAWTRTMDPTSPAKCLLQLVTDKYTEGRWRYMLIIRFRYPIYWLGVFPDNCSPAKNSGRARLSMSCTCSSLYQLAYEGMVITVVDGCASVVGTEPVSWDTFVKPISSLPRSAHSDGREITADNPSNARCVLCVRSL